MESGSHNSPDDIGRSAPEGRTDDQTGVKGERDELDVFGVTELVGDGGEQNGDTLQPDVVGEPTETCLSALFVGLV